MLALENKENREIINSSKASFKVLFNWSFTSLGHTPSFNFVGSPSDLDWGNRCLTKWDKLKIIKTCIKLLPELSRFKHLLKAKSYTELEKLINL